MLQQLKGLIWIIVACTFVKLDANHILKGVVWFMMCKSHGQTQAVMNTVINNSVDILHKFSSINYIITTTRTMVSLLWIDFN